MIILIQNKQNGQNSFLQYKFILHNVTCGFELFYGTNSKNFFIPKAIE